VIVAEVRSPGYKHYNAGRARAPSRASYLTGRYSYIQSNGERAPDGLQTQLRANDVIFPE
jgi:hypothetical protein